MKPVRIPPGLELLGWFCLVPVVFFGWIFGMGAWDRFQAAREVRAFVSSHQAAVDELRQDARVYKLVVAPAPDAPWELHIDLDIENRGAFDEVDAALTDSLHLRFPTTWQIKVRNHADLGNNWGAAAFGIGLVYQMMARIAIGGLLAVLVMALAMVRAFQLSSR